MQAVLYGVRDAIARVGVATCQGVGGAWGKANFGLGVVSPAPEIQNALGSEVSSKISAFVISAASRSNISSISTVLAVMLAGAFSVAYACFIICRANQRSSPGNHGYDRFYQALIRNSKLPIAILGRDMGCPISFCGGAEILLECLAGPDAADVARALDALLCKGISFETVLRGPDDRETVMHGTPVGRSCAVYFSIGKFAEDIADKRSVEKRLQRTADAFAQVVEHAPFAIAIFDSHQKLTIHNRKYALLWGLSESWLQSCPSKGEIIDRLRDERKLPEQKNFQQWKRFQLQPSADTDMKATELWHLPGGKSLRIVTTSHSEGGQLMMLEDISEQLALEASLNRLSQVQKATIDALDDAVAIFGPDGCLMLHNSNFEELWRLTPSELSNRPHCSEIARICDARMGRDEIWQVISDAINAMVPTTIIDIHETRRENGHLISLTLSRLPDGMTMAVFSDFSDLNRFEAMLEEDRSMERDSNSRFPQAS
jgi:PAS domain-containing protein